MVQCLKLCFCLLGFLFWGCAQAQGDEYVGGFENPTALQSPTPWETPQAAQALSPCAILLVFLAAPMPEPSNDLAADLFQMYLLIERGVFEWNHNRHFLSPERVHQIFQTIRIRMGMLVTAHSHRAGDILPRLRAVQNWVEQVTKLVVTPDGRMFVPLRRGQPRITAHQVLVEMGNTFLNLVEEVPIL